MIKPSVFLLTRFPLLTGNPTFSHFAPTMRPLSLSLSLQTSGKKNIDHLFPSAMQMTVEEVQNGNEWKYVHSCSLSPATAVSVFRHRHLADAAADGRLSRGSRTNGGGGWREESAGEPIVRAEQTPASKVPD